MSLESPRLGVSSASRRVPCSAVFEKHSRNPVMHASHRTRTTSHHTSARGAPWVVGRGGGGSQRARVAHSWLNPGGLLNYGLAVRLLRECKLFCSSALHGVALATAATARRSSSTRALQYGSSVAAQAHSCAPTGISCDAARAPRSAERTARVRRQLVSRRPSSCASHYTTATRRRGRYLTLCLRVLWDAST